MQHKPGTILLPAASGSLLHIVILLKGVSIALQRLLVSTIFREGIAVAFNKMWV
jgi:hypothetical protein